MFLAGINYFDGAARVTQWWLSLWHTSSALLIALFVFVQWNPAQGDVYL
jgi:hypothetical protein